MSGDIRFIKSLEEISDKYDFFIIDIYGVVYNGISLLEEAFKQIQRLIDKKKDVIFLSNTPRPAEVVRNRLITADHQLKFSNLLQTIPICTSGDSFVDYFVANYFEEFMGPTFLLGGSSNHDIIKLIDKKLKKDTPWSLEVVENPGNATSMILLAFNNASDTNIINQMNVLLELAAKNNLVCLCPNPDITTRYGETLVYTAGFYAQQYQEMGQRVVFFGKPYESIYKYAFKRLGLEKDHSNITQVKEKRRIVVIGDNMANDILGGHNIGVDSVLIGTKDDISEFQKQSDSNLTPTYCLYNLR